MDESNHDTEHCEVSQQNLFEKIWTSPTAVFDFVNTYHYDKHITLLLLLSGISRTFDRASLKSMGDQMPLWGVILFCVIVGGLFGWITYYIYAAMVSWSGKWLGGIANTQSILRVMAYALIPSIFAMLMIGLQIALYGNRIFQSDQDIPDGGLLANIIYYFSLLLELSLGIWSFILVIIGLSVVQKFSIWKALLNLLVPAFLLVTAMFIIVLILQMF